VSGFLGPTYLAVPGSTGNVTGTSIGLSGVSTYIAVLYVAEVAGTTATWKVQGSLDPGQTSDATSSWFDVPYVLPSTDTLSQAAIVRTSLGADLIWLAQSHVRYFRKIRLVVSANTGQTYRAELHQQYRN
jgi:hypothetical protein